MWSILIKMALPALIKGIEGRVGKEAVEVVQAAIAYAATAAVGGDERRAMAWAYCIEQFSELKLAIAGELSAGVPWFLNLLFEAMVARAKLAAGGGATA